jgi:hypothetical protein
MKRVFLVINQRASNTARKLANATDDLSMIEETLVQRYKGWTASKAPPMLGFQHPNHPKKNELGVYPGVS